MGKHRAGGTRPGRSGRRVRRLSRRATRMTVASSLLLPMPVAVAVPQAVTLTEDVLGVTRPSVTGVGDPATSHLTQKAGQGSGKKLGPAASVTRVGKIAKSAKSVQAE